MSRKQSNWNNYRKQQLPSNWEALKRQVKQRAKNQCEAVDKGHRCPEQGSECHHAGAPDDHRPESLQWLCADHHDEITRQQSREGQIIRQARLMHPMQRKRYLREKLGIDYLPESRRP